MPLPLTIISLSLPVCVFRGKLAEDSVDPRGDQRQSEESDATQTVQVTSVDDYCSVRTREVSLCPVYPAERCFFVV